MQSLILSLAALLCFAGCSLLPHKKKPVTARAGGERYPVGEVASVNRQAGFVLINIGGYPSPKPGLELETGPEGAVSGRLRTTGEVRRPYAAADIVDGEVQVGDCVWARPPDEEGVAEPVKAAEPGEAPRENPEKIAPVPVASGDLGV